MGSDVTPVQLETTPITIWMQIYCRVGFQRKRHENAKTVTDMDAPKEWPEVCDVKHLQCMKGTKEKPKT